MKAPIMPASTAIQAVRLAFSAEHGAAAGKDRPTAATSAALDMLESVSKAVGARPQPFGATAEAA